MTQNRNKLIELFIGNISNSVVHIILEKAIEKEKGYLADKYRKESVNSFELAKKYREKINPIISPLPEKDFLYIKNKIIVKVKAELRVRILKGYDNLNLDIVEQEVNKFLRDMNI
jgi:hypothetical protein